MVDIEDEPQEWGCRRYVEKIKRCIKQVIDSLWNRWRREYLLSLRQTHEMSEGKVANITPGDIVCINEEGVKRMRWKIGRVVEVIKGVDGVVRGAKLQVVSKKTKQDNALVDPCNYFILWKQQGKNYQTKSHLAAKLNKMA